MRLHISAKKNGMRYEVELDGEIRLLQLTHLRYLLALAVAAQSDDGWCDLRTLESEQGAQEPRNTKYVYAMRKAMRWPLKQVENDGNGCYRLVLAPLDEITFDW